MNFRSKILDQFESMDFHKKVRHHISGVLKGFPQCDVTEMGIWFWVGSCFFRDTLTRTGWTLIFSIFIRETNIVHIGGMPKSCLFAGKHSSLFYYRGPKYSHSWNPLWTSGNGQDPMHTFPQAEIKSLQLRVHLTRMSDPQDPLIGVVVNPQFAQDIQTRFIKVLASMQRT